MKDDMVDDVRLSVFTQVFSDAVAAVSFHNMILRRLLNDKGLVSNHEFESAESQLISTEWEKVRDELAAHIRDEIKKRFSEFAGGGSVH